MEGSKFITSNWKNNVANNPHTAQSCNDYCASYNTGGNTCVEFALGLTTNPGRCDIFKASDCTYNTAKDYEVYKPIPDPCRTLDLTSTSPMTYNTKIGISVKGGAFYESSMITVVIECGPNSATFTFPTINSPYIYPLLVQDPDMPRVELPAFTTD